MATATATGVPKTDAPPRTVTVDGVTFGAAFLTDADVWTILTTHAGGLRPVKVTYELSPGPPPTITGISKVESA